MVLPNPARQKSAREKLDQLFAYPDWVYAIHYACQSFYEGQQLASTRVACIAVRQVTSGQVTTFSIAKTAELYNIAPADIAVNWNSLERAMLGDFYEFVRANRTARFVHWNMRDDTFGFSAVAHRMQVLGRKPEEIPVQNCYDLARLLIELFGDGYVKKKERLEAISRLNGLAMSDFLPGGDEAAALEAGRYRAVQMSTQTKVRLIADLVQKSHDRTLQTQAPLLARYAGPWRIAADAIWRHPGRAVVGGGLTSSVPIYQLLKWWLGD